MLFYTVDQGEIFLTMLYAGLAVGLYASLDSAARRLFQAGRWLALTMDLLFGVVAAAMAAVALIVAADGELRLYSLLGLICGYLIFMGTLAPLLERILASLNRLLRALIHWLSRRTFLQKLLR